MRTLRVLVSASPATAPAAWALIEDSGRVVERGRGTAASWPAADRCEAVVGASALRVIALQLPPLPPARVEQAALYALEERLATPLDASIVVTGPQRNDGRVIALVLTRSLAQAIGEHRPAFDRVLAEPAMAELPATGTWRWCDSGEHGFVLTAQGDAFAVAAVSGPTLPGELRIALEQAARAGRAPERVLAAVPDAVAHRDAWSREGGVAFEPAPAWHWTHGEAPDLAPAIARALAPIARREPVRASFRFALAVGAIALAAHVLATIGTWGWRKVQLTRTQAAIADVAREAGATDAATLAASHAAARHAGGRAVDSDAWPRLARASPALSALPPGTLRSARFASGAWTLELGAIDDAALAAFEARLASAGMSAVTARTPSGLRVRLEA